MRSAALEKHEHIHCQPAQQKKGAKDDYDGKCASGMTEVLRQVLDVGAFRWFVDARHMAFFGNQENAIAIAGIREQE